MLIQTLCSGTAGRLEVSSLQVSPPNGRDPARHLLTPVCVCLCALRQRVLLHPRELVRTRSGRCACSTCRCLAAGTVLIVFCLLAYVPIIISMKSGEWKRQPPPLGVPRCPAVFLYLTPAPYELERWVAVKPFREMKP